MEQILTPKDLDHFKQHGFILIKNLFSPEELAELKKHIDSLKSLEPEAEKNGSYLFVGDAISKKLGHLVFDPRITSIAKQILGPKLVYFGESTIMTGIRAGRGFHRDNADREDPHGLDWQKENFPVIKMGLYLDNHKKFSGGLKIRKGSHLLSDFIKDPNQPKIKNQEEGYGQNYNIPSQSGDLILWSMRLAHSPNFLRFKFLPNICLPPKLENRLDRWLPKFLQSKLPKERKTIWITWGAPSPELDHYISYYVGRDDFIEHWKKSAYSPELVSQAAAQGIEIVKPIPEYGSFDSSQ